MLESARQVQLPNPASELVYKVAESPRERAGAFRLIYEAYTHCGLSEANPHGMRVTPYQLLPSTTVFVAMLRGEVVCTVSLVEDGDLGLPMESIFSREVNRLRRSGARLAEVSALADRRGDFERILPVFVNLNRLVGQFARRHGLSHVLIAVHPKHSRFYKRFMAFELIGDEKAYPTVLNRPAVPLGLDFERVDRLRPPNYVKFFGDAISPDHLERHPIGSAEYHELQPIADFCSGTGVRVYCPGESAWVGNDAMHNAQMAVA